MKKILVAALCLLSVSLLYAQDAFNPVDPVRMGPAGKAKFDTYVIGDGSQSYTYNSFRDACELQNQRLSRFGVSGYYPHCTRC